ncbi:alpha/beta hydrolase [Nocardioides sp. T2.26MG-1]|uniref:alpha/beta hydrolase n=1 Tax=Nocardioides sp. T2.26MG-1 TaxID=3041166 RepID=UPI002477680D|nr:alpha/beta hydrolase [Nocardioides sp. T2.26MG-1]CAI9416552.1 Carboxylesterase NlhH [Nocardioides sp. T2.26MG-1]
MTVDPQIAALLEFIASVEAKPMSEGTPAEARHGFRTLAVDLRDPAAVPDVASVEDTTVAGAEDDLPARVYRPAVEGPLPTIVLLHGGGFVLGDLDTHDVTARILANGCSAVVVSVDYRLAPEHPFPAPVDDAVAATQYVADHLARLGGDDRLAVAGDSAGGNLSAVVAQAFRDEGRPLAGQLLIYPVTDMTGAYPSHAENAEGLFLDLATMAWFQRQYTGDRTDLSDPRLSPLLGDLHGVAPAVVVVAEYDPLRDDGLAYAEALAAAGVPVEVRTFPGLVHGFVDMGRHSVAAQQALDETCALFHQVLHG